MNEKATTNGRQVEWSGEAPTLESLREVRLTALLADVMDELGQVKAAQKLGVDRKTLWRCRNTGELTPRLADALERLLLTQDLSAAMRQGKRVDVLERRLAELEEELRGGFENVVGEAKTLREEHAKSMRHVERRLVALEAGRDGTEGAAAGGPGHEPSKGRYAPPREYPQLVTLEAEPDEERVYGDATPVIVEWRKAKAEFSDLLKTGTALAQAEAKIRMLHLEIAIIEEHELTLPPASYPWNWESRRQQVRRREQSLGSAEVHRNRALRRLWLRRIFTCGIWRN